jgi:limonene-1,2-epoxide hydrolase
MNQLTTRRTLLACGSMGLMAGALPLSAGAEAPLGEREKSNIEFVKRFLVSCSANPFDAEKLVAEYFAPNASVRWTDDVPAAVGSANIIAAAKALMPAGSWVDIKLVDVFARGQLVATSRIDIFKVPGKPDTPTDIVGVHVIKDGKFIEYVDYIVK